MSLVSTTGELMTGSLRARAHLQGLITEYTLESAVARAVLVTDGNSQKSLPPGFIVRGCVPEIRIT